MTTQLPKEIDPIQLANEHAFFSGTLSFEGMERLLESIHEPQGSVEVELQFALDMEGTPFIHGKIKSIVQVICQRCLKAMNYLLESEFNLSPIEQLKDAEFLSEAYDPLITNGQPVLLKQMIEDELVLNLPFVTMHERSECSGASYVELDEQVNEVPEKENPFQVLKSLKVKDPN